ncbi:MAG TPA: hypothetical protein VN697_15040 [Tepidiformaceae bacterium]|nr:hypothetical protein [Tepidiformaceae bacterium]
MALGTHDLRLGARSGKLPEAALSWPLLDASEVTRYRAPVRILGLLNSNARGGDARIAAEDLFPNRMRGPLSQALGEPVEITARIAWPTPRLPRVAAQWMAESRPDLVVFPISSFWFLYESVPVRLERKLGPIGGAVAAASLRAAATPWLAHNGAFQTLRRTAQRTVGGSAYFEPGQVIEVATATIHSLLRDESPYLLVIGPSGGDQWATDSASAARIAAKRRSVDDSMGALCRSLHVEYWGASDIAAIRDPRKASLQGDRLHLDAEGHRRTAEHYLDPITALCRRAKAHAADEGSSPAPAPVA